MPELQIQSQSYIVPQWSSPNVDLEEPQTDKVKKRGVSASKVFKDTAAPAMTDSSKRRYKVKIADSMVQHVEAMEKKLKDLDG